MKITVLIADDHKIMRDGLMSLLAQERDIDVIGQADNGRSTVSLARKLEPDIVVMDVAMPDLNGVDATRKLQKLMPETYVLALSAHSEGVYVKGMLEAGARGYMVKDAASEELLQAIRTISRGRLYVSPSITDTLVGDYLLRVQGKITAESDVLTVREREVLQLVSEGQSSAQIAKSLNLSDRTVDTHRKRIMDKLGIRSVAELTKYAIKAGITSL
ncbi:MAG: response regulator transcription factor [Pseudomonadota bacterium]